MTLLALLAAALVLTGCGATAGGGDPSQASREGERASRNDEPKPEKRAGDSGKPEKAAESSGGERATKKRLGHPALGAANAPVVLTEYSDYQ